MTQIRSKFNLDFLPKDYQDLILKIKKEEKFTLILSNPRKSKLGDYRHNYLTRSHTISVNIDLSPFIFLVTFLHEVAHKRCQVQFGRKAAPHGKEWKNIFVDLLWYAKSEIIFSKEDETNLFHFIQNPSARFNLPATQSDELQVQNLQPNTVFELSNGEKFKLLHKRRTRYLCLKIENKREYTVLGTAFVKKIH